MQRISIDPITRLEGHGKIDIFLDDAGEVANAYLQIPELRGFETFCVGTPAEALPHPASNKLPELMYSIFNATDHTTPFYALGAPDFIVGPEAPVAERNILGVIQKVGMDVAGKGLKMRRGGHHLISLM